MQFRPAAADIVTKPDGLKSIPDYVVLEYASRIRDLDQLGDNLNDNGEDPIALASLGELGKANAAVPTRTIGRGETLRTRAVPGSIVAGQVEIGGGAAFEVGVQKGYLLLESVANQMRAMPKITPNGDPVIASFLARAGYGFTREERDKEGRKSQYRMVAEEARDVSIEEIKAGRMDEGQSIMTRIDIFDTPHRAEWLREDFEAIYELHFLEGLPIMIGGMTGVSDDAKLTEDAFRQRVRAVLEMEAEVREKFFEKHKAELAKKGISELPSIMDTHILKNTDGRLQGSDVPFSEGNARIYGQIQKQEMARIWRNHGTGPRKAGFHTHNIGRARASTAAYMDGFLSVPSTKVTHVCVDMMEGVDDFASFKQTAADMRDHYGWDIQVSDKQADAMDDMGHLLKIARAPFLQNAPYMPTEREWLLFNCAPAAYMSGVRFGAIPAAEKQLAMLGDEAIRTALVNVDVMMAAGRKAYEETDGPFAVKQEAQQRAEQQSREMQVMAYRAKVMEEKRQEVTVATIRTWGMLNGAAKRLLDGYSITPVANHHNRTAGDIAMQAALENLVGQFIKSGIDPTQVSEKQWDDYFLKHLDKIVQRPVAQYLTRADVKYNIHPLVLDRLYFIRTAPHLPELQKDSVFADKNIENYVLLREQLLKPEVLRDKEAARQVFKAHKLKGKWVDSFISSLIGPDERQPLAGARSQLTECKALADEIGGSDRKLHREVMFAANVGSLGGVIPKGKLEALRDRPARKFVSLEWWQGVGAFNTHERHVWDIYKRHGVSSFSALLHKEGAAAAALEMAAYFIEHKMHFRSSLGIEFGLFKDSAATKYREVHALAQRYRAKYMRMMTTRAVPMSYPSVFGAGGPTAKATPEG